MQLGTPVDCDLFPNELLDDHGTVERKGTYMKKIIEASKERERESMKREKQMEKRKVGYRNPVHHNNSHPS